MRALLVHAHYDDYEFTTAGTFERCRRAFGDDFVGRVLICTDGAAGHHQLTRAQTARRRLAEQRASARLGGYEFRLLRLPNGRVPREGCLEPDRQFLAALWQAIREFRPDYLFSPPLATDPLAGVHVDHQVTAEGVRRVAYLLNVPHAFSPEFPKVRGPAVACPVPVILNTYDSYLLGTKGWDFAVDIEEAMDQVAQLSWQHQSQIQEWLPWVGRHRMEPVSSLAEWTTSLRQRFGRRQRQLGIRCRRLVEVFTVTAWGEIPTVARLQRDFPGLQRSANVERLRRRIRTWRS